MKNVFGQIRSRLISSSETAVEGNALKRINTLSGLISGMIRKGSSHLPDLGSGIRKDIDSNSKTVAAKRFIENKWTDYEVHFLPFLLSFLRGVILCMSSIEKGIVLVIDGSQTGKDNAALMISLVWGKRGIPICWIVKKGAKGHFKTVIQKLCLSQGWNYVLRTARSTVFYKNGERFQAKSVSPDSSHDVYFIDSVEFTEDRFKYVNFICWHDDKRHEEPIYLVSNLACVGQIIEFYDQRYSIECLFKDLKSTSFNVHKTRLKNPEEVSNLLIIAALAFILLTVLAIQYDQEKWRKKVQRVRNDRKVLSFFSFAFKLIDYFDDYDINFNFSFQFSKNFYKFSHGST